MGLLLAGFKAWDEVFDFEFFSLKTQDMRLFGHSDVMNAQPLALSDQCLGAESTIDTQVEGWPSIGGRHARELAMNPGQDVLGDLDLGAWLMAAL